MTLRATDVALVSPCYRGVAFAAVVAVARVAEMVQLRIDEHIKIEWTGNHESSRVTVPNSKQGVVDVAILVLERKIEFISLPAGECSFSKP